MFHLFDYSLRRPKHVNKDHENKIKVLNANLKEKLLKSKMNDKVSFKTFVFLILFCLN